MTHKRVFVNKSEKSEIAIYGRCLLDALSDDASIFIAITEDENSVTITQQDGGIPFMHAPSCPVRQEFDRSLLLDGQIRLAVAALIENVDTGEIMITRRPKHMRSFPMTWVVPGGGLENDETTLQTLKREVQEEVGLDISGAEIKPFFCWESCFPVFIEHGIPKRQHFVPDVVANIDCLLPCEINE